MNDSILNIINSFLSYGDGLVTDNPHLRQFDHTRRISSISVTNPKSDARIVAPNASVQLFDGSVPHLMDGSSTIDLQLLAPTTSTYRLKVTSGPSGFRTARAVSGLAGCSVTINNNAVAVFNFAAATLTAVQPGDIMRIAGAVLNDTGPFAFNPLNAGLWVVLAVSGTQISCVRQSADSWSAAIETVVAVGSDVQFYSAAGVQAGNKFSVTGTLSVVSQRTYEVLDATPNTIDFVSATPIPLETGLTYVPNSITFYSESKRFVYIEADQDCVVRFNGDASDCVKITPIKAGEKDYIGFMTKWGDAYSCTVVNKSINPVSVRFMTCE